MSILNLNDPTPQFNKAEYGQPSTDTCKFCGLTIAGSYYRVNEAMSCANCAQKQRLEQPDDSQLFVRALLLGVGGAAVGMALYAGFVIATDFTIGYLALAVGWIVAKAMLIGSKGVGGRKYQITAAILTYAAVAFSVIPIILWSRPGLEIDWGILLTRALVSPFLALQYRPTAFIGLIILYVGVQIAWKMAAGKPAKVVEGPFQISSAMGAR